MIRVQRPKKGVEDEDDVLKTSDVLVVALGRVTAYQKK